MLNPESRQRDTVPVFLAEERHRAGCHRFLCRSFFGDDRHVSAHLLVHDLLDLEHLLVRDRRRVDEIESQPVGRDERACLLHVRAEHLSQRGVEQVCRCVVSARCIASRCVDFGGDDVALVQRPAFNSIAVQSRHPDDSRLLPARRRA